MLREAFDQVGQTAPPASEPERLFREWRQGNLSLFQYQAGTAHWVSTFHQQYQPRPIPQISQALRDYVYGRKNGRRERDDNLGSKLGLWICLTNECLYQNEGDCELFRWCIEIMEQAEGASLIPDLKRQLAILERSVVAPRELAPAIDVQRMDSDDRRRA